MVRLPPAKVPQAHRTTCTGLRQLVTLTKSQVDAILHMWYALLCRGIPWGWRRCLLSRTALR